MARGPNKPKASKLRDVDLALAPFVGPDGEETPNQTTARGLLLQALDDFRQYEQRRWPLSILNERFIAGEQQWGVATAGPMMTPSELTVDWPKWLPRTQRNLLKNLHLTAIARVTKGDPAVKAWGGDPSIGDVVDSDVGNKLVYHLRTNQDHRKLIMRGAWSAAAQGTCAFYVTWNASSGPRGVDGKPQGDIAFEPLQVFDWGTDGSEDIEKSAYCFIRRYMKVNEAKRLLVSVGVMEEPEVKTIEGVWGDTQTERVEAIEYWQKPDPNGELPNGLMVLFVGGHVVKTYDPYPYDHGELPLCVWKWTDVPDSPYGSTPVDDAVPIQAILNRLHSYLAFITGKTAKWMKVLTTKKIEKLWNGDAQVIGSDDIDNDSKTQIVGAPPPPALLYTQIEEAERMLREVYGVNEAVVGSDASKSKNAKHLEHIDSLDAQKLYATVVARDHALFRAYRQMLRLWQQYVQIARTIRILGEDGKPAALQFAGADLDGVDLYLEPAPGADLTRAAGALDAEQAAVAGYIDPKTAAELRQTGQNHTAFSRVGRRIVQKQIEDARRGFAAQADPSVPAEVAVPEITLAMQMLAPTETAAYAALQALLQGYQQAAAPVAAPTNAPKPMPADGQPPVGVKL